MYKNKSIVARAKFAVIYSVYKTEENLLKNKAIADRLFPQDKQALYLLFPKIQLGHSFYLRAICCRNSKTIS